MPRLDVPALQTMMTRRNVLFKHQLANLVGISYERLAQLMASPGAEVDEQTLRRLCSGLDCEAADLVVRGRPCPGGDRLPRR